MQSVIPGLGIPVFGFFFGTAILAGFLYVFTYGARKHALSRASSCSIGLPFQR